MITITEAFEAYHGYLLRVAVGLTSDPDIADDLVSATWERAVRNWHHVDDSNMAFGGRKRSTVDMLCALARRAGSPSSSVCCRTP